MTKILPYKKGLETCQGAFIEPNGKILYVHGNHEKVASEYCTQLFQQKQYQSYANQLKLYKEWLIKHGHSLGVSHCDFLVFLLSFDKVENGIKRTITTIEKEPHIRFFNYYLMDWYINQEMPLKLNKKTGLYEIEKKHQWYDGSVDDRDAEEEIKEIKKQIVYEKRPLFFK